MGFRFQKRIKVLPGATLNLSKKGVSTSVGVTGARVTYGHGQKRTMIGLPGTGISHTQIGSNKSPDVRQNQNTEDQSSDTKNLLVGIAFIAALFAAAGMISKCAA